MRPHLIPALALAFGLALNPAASAQAQDAPPAAESQSEAQFVAGAPAMHPGELYAFAARLLGEGRGLDAARWMYAAQLRYRFLLAVQGTDTEEGALFAALHETVGRPINEYIGGDVDEWLDAMDWALDWDAANDNAETSKTEHAAQWQAVRSGLAALRAEIEKTRDDIPGLRTQQGLENR